MAMRDITDRLTQKTIKEKYGIDVDRTLHLIKDHDLVGVLIKKAVEQGEFDNLKGSGKPLNLEGNPYEQLSDLHMAHKILKDNGFAPYWIELGKEIDKARNKVDQEVDNFKRYKRMFLEEKRSAAAIHRFEQKKKDFYTRSRERLEELSKKILDYNLHCPVSALQRFNIDVDEEINKIVADID